MIEVSKKVAEITAQFLGVVDSIMCSPVS